MKIFGIGLPRTGTTSLSQCLQHLGYTHVKYREDLLMDIAINKSLTNAFQTIDKFDSCSDLPWPLIYQELDKQFIDSKFILTVRKDSETWINSYSFLVRKRPNTKPRELVYGYSSPVNHEADYINKYERHNQNVRDYFKGEPNKLLVCCWELGSGWSEVCSFLDKEKPGVEFPHTNKSL